MGPMKRRVVNGVLNWATILEDNTREQAERTARMPFVKHHLALMPDAHLGFGSTIGSVIPTRGAIIPSAVGVDIGCGMAAVKLSLKAENLPNKLGPVLGAIREAVPAGVGKSHEKSGPTNTGERFVISTLDHRATELTERQNKTAAAQFGTLGAGNHFVEVSLDGNDNVWIVLHSGSRGIGNQLAKHHIEKAKGIMKAYFIELEDPELAYFVEGTPEFDAYWTDLQWAQDYAKENRRRMLGNILTQVIKLLPPFTITDRINCHHNYSALEHHMGQNLYITRKGAISATEGERGIIPGSMGTSTFLVEGLGNVAAFKSAPHGAGRSMSRGQARRQFTPEDLKARMGNRTWNTHDAKSLLDEIPDSYKDIHQVMKDSEDLAVITHELHSIINYKGA